MGYTLCSLYVYFYLPALCDFRIKLEVGRMMPTPSSPGRRHRRSSLAVRRDDVVSALLVSNRAEAAARVHSQLYTDASHQ